MEFKIGDKVVIGDGSFSVKIIKGVYDTGSCNRGPARKWCTDY